MVKANELRIGNIISVIPYGDHLTVSEIHDATETFKDDSWVHTREDVRVSDMSRVAGILLTPEILEKCGFRPADGYDFPTYEDDLGNRVSFDAGIYKYWLGGIYQDWAEIRSLHRLQNFHFEYTNRELEVTL